MVVLGESLYRTAMIYSSMATKEYALDLIKNQYKKGERICLIIWSKEDVLTRAKERGIKITIPDAEEIIDEMEHRHDASIGVCWETIDTYLNNIEQKLMEEDEAKRQKERVNFT